MKKKILAAAAVLSLAGSVFAYNPPAGGQNVLRLSSPFLLTAGNSAAGGALFDVIPSSIVNNPALTAFEQRIVLDVGGTVLLDKNDDDKELGGAFQAGLTLPSRWCVGSFLGQAIFSPLIDMHLMNNIAFTANVSKDINDKVSVGVSGNYGYFWGHGKTDWTGSAAVGAFYRFGDFLFMKDIRFGAAVTNLGLMYTKTEKAVVGIKRNKDSQDWPAFLTGRAGVAATFVDTGDFKIGLSADVASPAFQNVVVNAGAAIAYKDFLKITSAWEYDMQEFIENKNTNMLPSVGVHFTFRFNAKKGSTLANHGWEESDITVGSAWKQLYEDVNAFSAGMIFKLGLEDKDPPIITLWGED